MHNTTCIHTGRAENELQSNNYQFSTSNKLNSQVLNQGTKAIQRENSF